MSVDLKRLPADEEKLRCMDAFSSTQTSIQNVLDALNWFRCLALHNEQALARANAELIEVRNSADHDRIFGESRS